MALFLILGPTVFFGLLITNLYRADSKVHARLFSIGLASAACAATLQFLTRGWFPLSYGSAWGFIGFWFHDFFWPSAACAIPMIAFPSLRSAWSRGVGQGSSTAGRKESLISFSMGAVAPFGLLTLLYLGPPRDPYYLFYLPILWITLAIIIPAVLDRAFSEYGFPVYLWSALAVLAGPFMGFIAVFHFWGMAYVSLPGIALACLAAYLCLFRPSATVRAVGPRQRVFR